MPEIMNEGQANQEGEQKNEDHCSATRDDPLG
jgi:hypothetical protein